MDNQEKLSNDNELKVSIISQLRIAYKDFQGVDLSSESALYFSNQPIEVLKGLLVNITEIVQSVKQSKTKLGISIPFGLGDRSTIHGKFEVIKKETKGYLGLYDTFLYPIKDEIYACQVVPEAGLAKATLIGYPLKTKGTWGPITFGNILMYINKENSMEIPANNFPPNIRPFIYRTYNFYADYSIVR